METTRKRLLDFFDIEDENGVSNLDKVHRFQKVLRRVETTDKNCHKCGEHGCGKRSCHE